jgi:hypothetical protein
MKHRVSGWLLLSANSAIFQLHHDENKLIFNEMMTNTLSWILFIVLAHWNNSSQIDMSSHSDTLSWFIADQSLPFLLNAACLAEKQQIPILYYLVWPDRGKNPRSTTIEASTLTVTPPMRSNNTNVNYRLLCWKCGFSTCRCKNVPFGIHIDIVELNTFI